MLCISWLVCWDQKHSEQVLWVMDVVRLLALSLLGSEMWLSCWFSLCVLLHSLSVWRAGEGTGDIPPAPTACDRSGGDGKGSLALVGPMISTLWFLLQPGGNWLLCCGQSYGQYGQLALCFGQPLTNQ